MVVGFGMKRISVRAWLTWVVLLCAILVPVGWLFRATQRALVAEEHLQAMFRAVIAAQLYVEAHPGDWPNSWQELYPYIPPEIDAEWVAANVDFDFSAGPADLAEQSCHSFSGIRPHEPCLRAYENLLEQLISTVRDQRTVSAVPQSIE